MAEHKDYSGAIRRLQGNNELEIGSTGQLTNYGKNVRSSSGYDQDLFETVVGDSTESTGGKALKRTGLSILSTTGSTGSRAVFRLPSPLPGVSKRILALQASTGAAIAVVQTTAATITFASTATNHQLAFNKPAEAVALEGLSTSQWGIMSNVDSVGVTTDFG